jgi:hypothetical protein
MSRTSVPLERLAGCVRDVLAEKGIKVCGVYLTTGQQIAIDQPPGESMAWVRMIDITSAAAETENGTVCASQLLMSIEVGIAHCWELKEETLTVEEHLKHQVQMDDSMWALFKALACCPAWVPDKRTLSVARWQPIGPQGGTIGGAWLATVVV